MKTTFTMRACALLFALILVSASFLSACQPTPEVEPVPNKGDNIAGQKIEASAVPAADTSSPEGSATQAPPVFPEHWYEDIRSATGRMLVDADVVTTGQTTFPVYSIKRAVIDQELLQPMLDYFFPKIKAWKYGYFLGVEDYEEQLKRIPEAMAALGLPPESEQRLAESQMRFINNNLNHCSNSDADFIPAERIDLSKTTVQTVMLEDGRKGLIDCHGGDFIEICAHIDSYVQRSMFAAWDWWNAYYMDEEDFEYPITDEEAKVWLQPEITLEEAMAGAEDFFEKTGLEGYELSWSEAAQLEESATWHSWSTGWLLEFVRTFSYYPIDASRNDAGKKGKTFVQNPDDYSPGWPCEVIELYVSKNGVENFRWTYPVEIVELANENVELMPFDELAASMKRVLLAAISYSELHKMWHKIDRVILTVAPQRKKDSNEAYLMPIWLCMGYIYMEDQPDSTLGGDWHDTKWYMAFNAIDGTRVYLSPPGI